MRSHTIRHWAFRLFVFLHIPLDHFFLLLGGKLVLVGVSGALSLHTFRVQSEKSLIPKLLNASQA